MRLISRKLAAGLTGTLMTLASGTAAFADDTEIFFNQGNTGTAANILLILDTSGSMDDTLESTNPYDGSKTYKANKCSSSFDKNAYYFGTKVPGCGSTAKLAITQFKCDYMGDVTKSASGYFTGVVAQWASSVTSSTTGKKGNKKTTTTTTYGWSKTLSGNNTTGLVECKADAGKHGNGTDTSKLYPSTDTYSVVVVTDNDGKVISTSGNVTGAQLTGVWDATKNYWTGNSGGNYTIYSGNYLNYYYDSSQTTETAKMRTMQLAASALLNSVSGVNVGVMRYDRAGSGGMVLGEMDDLANNKTTLTNLINSWGADGVTPLSQTLYEAYLYYAGKKVKYGDTSSSSTCTDIDPDTFECNKIKSFTAHSVAGSRKAGNSSEYKSPADYSCQKNYIVYLTDGLPNENSTTSLDPTIKALPNFSTIGGACDTSNYPNSTGGRCTAALARYMNGSDLRTDVAGRQNVTSYFIGFGQDFVSGGAPTSAFSYLDTAASAGGGKAYSATSLNDLTSVFDEIFNEVLTTNTIFSAPAVAVNAFNRTQTLNDLYVSVFSPRLAHHWPGNMKKYKVVNGDVVDSKGDAAVNDASGFFNDSSRSYWSAVDDGADVTLGGAAANIPDPANRTVYVYKDDKLVKLAVNTYTDVDLGVTGAEDPDVDDVINWALGADLNDDDKDGSKTDSRHAMGDPVHAQPQVVVYGKNANGTDNVVVYVPTNDGYLHAVDGNTGVELWAFIPPEMIPSLKDLYIDTTVEKKHYGLDGQTSVLKYDINGDGTINATAGDRVFIFFGTGRNWTTSNYYAMEVTDKANPKFLWSLDAGVLPGLGQAWSAPVITRMDISGATQNSQKLVLVISGGYDTAEENYNYQTSNAVGTHIYFVDALKGTLLWAAGGVTETDVTFVHGRMTHSIPSPVTVMDMDGDTYGDRMYVGDTAGQLWRFDIWNGQAAGTLVTGGIIGSFGAKDESPRTMANTRRFYSAPDVSAVQKIGIPPYLNIGIGSGYRGHPLDTQVRDKFYVIRDYLPFAKMTKAQYDDTNRKIAVDSTSSATSGVSKLVDITLTPNPSLAPDAAGWQLSLDQHGGWIGEKVLSPSRTFEGNVIFTTYVPNTGTGKPIKDDPCAGVGTGTNRVYVVSVDDGSPVLDKNNDGVLDTDERSTDLSQGGIAPEAAFLFPVDEDGGGGGGEEGSGAGTGRVVCLSGVEVLSVCSSFNQRRKTYWREGSAN